MTSIRLKETEKPSLFTSTIEKTEQQKSYSIGLKRIPSDLLKHTKRKIHNEDLNDMRNSQSKMDHKERVFARSSGNRYEDFLSLKSMKRDQIINKAEQDSSQKMAILQQIIRPHKSQLVVNQIKKSYLNHSKRIKILIQGNRFQGKQFSTHSLASINLIAASAHITDDLQIESTTTSIQKAGTDYNEAQYRSLSSNGFHNEYSEQKGLSNLFSHNNRVALPQKQTQQLLNQKLLQRMQLEKKKDEQRGAVNSILGQVLKEKLRAISQMQKKETPLELGIQRIVKPRALNESISKKSIKSRSIGLNRAKISKSKTIIRQLGQASYDASTFIRNKLLGGSTQQTEQLKPRQDQRKSSIVGYQDVIYYKKLKFDESQLEGAFSPWIIDKTCNKFFV